MAVTRNLTSVLVGEDRGTIEGIVSGLATTPITTSNKIITELDLPNQTTGNYIRNGGFDEWSRGTPITVSGYSVDGWTGSGFTVTRVAGITRNWKDNPFYVARLTPKTLGVYSSISQIMLGSKAKLAGKTVTISFSAMGTITDPITVNSWEKGDTGTLLPFVNNLYLTQSPTRYSFTAVIPDEAYINESLYVRFAIQSPTTTTDYLEISDVQFEVGSVATSFIQEDPATIRNVNRFYLRKYATQQNVFDLSYQMNSTPTEIATTPYYLYSAEL